MGCADTVVPPAGFVRFALAGITSEPWLNGGGLTRQVAAGRFAPQPAPCAPGEPWDWRISVAVISRDGPFSTFDGADRSAVLIEGALGLHQGDDELDFARPGDLRNFAGEVARTARLRGARARLFNVMVQRARCHAIVRVPGADARVDAGGPGCLFVADGAFRVEFDEPRAQPVDLLPQDGLYWQAIAAGCTVRRLTATGLLVQADFRPHPRLRASP